MAAPPKLVNKQFNSPIGLYSEHNIKEVLRREEQILANGAVGIDFHNSQIGKPTNLQNSAVLRMLEEEEHRQRGGRAGNETDYVPRPLRDLNWPPQEYLENQHRASFKDVVVPGAKKVTWPPNFDDLSLEEQQQHLQQQSAAQTQGGPQYPHSQGLQQNNYAPQQEHNPYRPTPASQYRPLKPLDVSSVASGSPLVSPAPNQSPQVFRPATPAKGWAPVSPVSTPTQPQWRTQAPPHQVSSPYGQSHSPNAQHQSVAPPQRQVSSSYGHSPSVAPPHQQVNSPYARSSPSAQNQSVAPSHPQVSSPYAQSPPVSYPNAPVYQSQSFAAQSPAQQTQAVAAQGQAAYRPQQKQVEPPPSVITLRQEAPRSQASPPVYKSQPTTATLKGGKHLRGDLKWPPEEVKERMKEEIQQQLELAKGPACKPRKQQKDYSRFFAQHALNSTYPGYKIPPGTQFFRPEY